MKFNYYKNLKVQISAQTNVKLSVDPIDYKKFFEHLTFFVEEAERVGF